MLRCHRNSLPYLKEEKVLNKHPVLELSKQKHHDIKEYDPTSNDETWSLLGLLCCNFALVLFMPLKLEARCAMLLWVNQPMIHARVSRLGGMMSHLLVMISAQAALSAGHTQPYWFDFHRMLTRWSRISVQLLLMQLQYGPCALRHGIEVLMEAILACHPALSTEWLAGWQNCVYYDTCAQAQFIIFFSNLSNFSSKKKSILKCMYYPGQKKKYGHYDYA